MSQPVFLYVMLLLLLLLLMMLTTCQELYKSIEKLRPNLFRMASELKQNEEGMTDILQTNDSVLRVMDLYDAKFNKNKPKATLTTTSNGMGDEKTSGNTAEGSSASTGPSEGATAVTATTTVASGSEGQGVPTAEGGASGRSEPANALIDLADLNFDPTPVAGAGGNSVPGGASGFGASTGLGSLLSELGTLGKDGHWKCGGIYVVKKLHAFHCGREEIWSYS